MASKAAHKRLTREYQAIQANPTPFITALPSEARILEWHYVIDGPPDTPYEGGQYHGTLVFPADYPFKPPAIRMITPSGRFKTNTRLCLSISDYHPKSWNPAWSVSTILTGLLSFMVGDETTAGSIVTTDAQKRVYARESHRWNLENDSMFREHFPELAEKSSQDLSKRVVPPVAANGAVQTVANNVTATFQAIAGTAPADTLAGGSNSANNAAVPDAAKPLMTRGQFFGVCVLLVSWIVASRMLRSSVE